MKFKTIIMILFLTPGTCRCLAQESPSPAKTEVGAVSGSKSDSPDLAAIREASQLFVAAFNQHDASAIAALWTEDGEYIDGTGRALAGRDEIETDYQDFFAANPDAKIEIVIDSLRLLSGETAIEDGRASVSSSTGDAGQFTNYTVVHAKVGGRWLMASVREALVEPRPSVASSADLEWLVGTWNAEEHGVKIEFVCSWAVDGRFIERKYTTTQIDGTKSSGVQLIGWNPQGGHVQSWEFSPDGGHAVGIWVPQQGGWSSQMRGVTGDGMLTTAMNQLRRLDDNAYVWQSIQRTVGGIAIPDTDEVVIKRLPVTH